VTRGRRVLVLDDLAPFADIPPAKAQAMIDDVMALAARVAPCILDADFAHDAAAVGDPARVILRWHEAGSGALQTASVDDYSFSFDTRQQRRTLFWPSEIEELQALCKTGGLPGAFAVDTVGVALGSTPTSARCGSAPCTARAVRC
jgi:hypothetical protein